MPGRPAFFTDNQVRGPVVRALLKSWDVVRAVDVFGQENDDEVLFAHAASEGRIFLTSDEGIHATAHGWLKEGRTSFRMIFYRMELHREMTDGEIVDAIEEILHKPDAFAYPIEYVKPLR